MSPDMLSRPHLILLATFLRIRAAPAPGDAYWAAILGEPVEGAMGALLRMRAIERPPLVDVIEDQLTVSELKAMLKKAGAKVSGKKRDLAERLVEMSPDAARARIGAVHFFRCATQFRDAALAHLSSEVEAQAGAERDTEAALAVGDLRRAAAIVERARGTELGEEATRTLELIHALTPAILWAVSPDAMPTLRRLAALSFLWGDCVAERAIPDGFWTGIHLDPVTAALMLIFAAHRQMDLMRWELGLSGRRQYRVDAIDDPNHCTACRALAARPPVLRLEDIPELPHPGCTSPMGCRCSVARERLAP